MKTPLLCLILLLPPCATVQALPNSVLGAVRKENSPLDGKEMTDLLLGLLGDQMEKLPGRWQHEGTLEDARISHLLARPRIFGETVELVRAVHRGAVLESLEFTFVDAGSYFGYFQLPPDTPRDLTRKQQQALMDRLLADKQQTFDQLYGDTLEKVRDGISRLAGKKDPKRVRIGKTRALRAEADEWRAGGRTVRLLADGKRLVRVTVHHGDPVTSGWLDPSLASLSDRDRLERLAGNLSTTADGAKWIVPLRSIPQGYQPYCGLNTLAMAARYFGLHLDEDWLAVAGGFQNTGSAAGSNILGLYQAVASEAGLRMDRPGKPDANTLRRSLDQGLPVIVWRRFSHERDALHTRFAAQLRRDPASRLPDPVSDLERRSWPGESAPLHASVIVGYHPGRGECLFLESWTGNDTPRRMSLAELEATAYKTFAFIR